MASVGIAMIAIGIGSLVMRSMGQQYVFLRWAEDLQPYFGVVLAVLGVAITVAGLLVRARRQRP